MLVGEVKKLGCWWVVRGADGVDSQGAQGGEAALPCGERDGGAEGSRVSVEGYAVDLVVLAIEEEAVVGVEVEFADAEGDKFVVNGFAVAEKENVRSVEHGMIEVPEIWVRDVNHVFDIGGGVGGYDFGKELVGVPDVLAFGCRLWRRQD